MSGGEDQGRWQANGSNANGSNGNGNGPLPEQSQLSVPGPNDVLEALLKLNRNVTVDMHADEVVHNYLDAFKQLFPERMFCVRLFAAETGELSLVYATGRLDPEHREAVEITHASMERHGIDVGETPADTSVSQEYRPLFVDGDLGFDIPTMDGPNLAGLLNVEYRAGVRPPCDDHALIVQLGLQLGGALRNSRLHRESVYLKDYLGKLLDNANAPIMVMGKQGRVSFANRAFLAITAFQRKEVLGKDWMGLLPEAERRRMLPIYINTLRGEPTSNVEVRLPRRDGSFAHVAVNTASILSPDGEVEGVIYIYRDISEVRELEEQIIQAEKLATLGQLAAGVVHELNNPLTSISAYSDFLIKKGEQRQAEPGDQEKLRRIAESADRILNFTRDLVTYARPSAEQPTLLSITDVIDQAVVFCEHLVDECGARITKDYQEELPDLYGIKGQLVQVLVNLVTNACHAMPLGAGHLNIETRARAGGLVVVRVSDSGRGIPEDNLSRVFEPFFSTKGEGKGTGLGLSIVNNIVQQHRGTIAVSSEVGQGTTFEMVLPCRADPRETAD